MTALSVGEPAPDFTLPTDGGGSVSLKGLRGRKVVVFFYPRADTPGCTLESREFSQLKPQFAEAGTELIGVSADPVKAQDKFKKKYDLTVTLGSDVERKMVGDYGVWVEKSMYGKKYMGIERTTLLIDGEGRIARIWPKVAVENHAKEVLEAAKAL